MGSWAAVRARLNPILTVPTTKTDFTLNVKLYHTRARNELA